MQHDLKAHDSHTLTISSRSDGIIMWLIGIFMWVFDGKTCTAEGQHLIEDAAHTDRRSVHWDAPGSFFYYSIKSMISAEK